MGNQKSTYQAKIKIYSDGADRASLLEMNQNPLIQGMTTNPSLMRKAGVTNYKAYCQDILGHIKEKPISFEVFADDLPEMARQAAEIATWGKNVYVKIPIMNSRGETTIPVIREMAKKNIKLNITALFTLRQTLETCEAVKGGAAMIASVFAGRIADTGRDPMPLVKACREICDSFNAEAGAGGPVELLWASTREVYNIVQAEECGCHIITAPADIIKKLGGFNRDLKAMSLDTVKAFKSDSDAAGFAL